ncbi:helix-turn-helix transcriptional regulator [Olsenella umbonata]|uniref:Helix-turn-helix transcriptional regulator n=3 Tax=Parafannyhessea umbonata TaxID=604330 RepID=A0A6N7WWL7_9ACTN|nr:helix-turn-helix transcriptional regulator [Parafannyhessea umbonata]
MESHMTDDQLRTIFKALADARRLAIVRTLERDGEVCACNLLDGLGISQPTLSHHMKVLCDSGLVRCRKDSRWCYYSVDAEVAHEVSAAFGLLADAAAAGADAGACAEGGARTCAREGSCDCGN